MTWSEIFVFITKSLIYDFEQVVLAVVHYDVKNYHQYLYDEFNIILPDNIRLSCCKRGAEYLAGRLAAKLCLLHLGESDYNVYPSSSGKPCWPGLMVGSISHSPTIAVSIVCSSNDSNRSCCSVGIDVENIVSMQDVKDLSPLVMVNDEIRFLFSEIYCEEQMFTAIFSAKEASFKAVSYFGEYSIDFRSLYVEEFNFDRNQYVIFSEQSNCWVKGRAIITRGYVLAIAFVYYGLDMDDDAEEYSFRDKLSTFAIPV